MDIGTDVQTDSCGTTMIFFPDLDCWPSLVDQQFFDPRDLGHELVLISFIYSVCVWKTRIATLGTWPGRSI